MPPSSWRRSSSKCHRSRNERRDLSQKQTAAVLPSAPQRSALRENRRLPCSEGRCLDAQVNPRIFFAELKRRLDCCVKSAGLRDQPQAVSVLILRNEAAA